MSYLHLRYLSLTSDAKRYNLPHGVLSGFGVNHATLCSKRDLLLSDAVKPRMGGAELSHRMRAAFPNVKVILMSGYAHAVATEESAEPADDVVFLQKPFAHRELADIVGRLLSSSQLV